MSKFSSQSRDNSFDRKDMTSRGSTSRDSKGKVTHFQIWNRFAVR